MNHAGVEASYVSLLIYPIAISASSSQQISFIFCGNPVTSITLIRDACDSCTLSHFLLDTSPNHARLSGAIPAILYGRGIAAPSLPSCESLSVCFVRALLDPDLRTYLRRLVLQKTKPATQNRATGPKLLAANIRRSSYVIASLLRLSPILCTPAAPVRLPHKADPK
jgi:hypothetical protein